MSVPIDPDRLRFELAIRGMSANELAKKARLSPATVSSALAGKPIAEASLKLVADVLSGTPASEFLERLVAPGMRRSRGDQPHPSTARP